MVYSKDLRVLMKNIMHTLKIKAELRIINGAIKLKSQVFYLKKKILYWLKNDIEESKAKDSPKSD